MADTTTPVRPSTAPRATATTTPAPPATGHAPARPP